METSKKRQISTTNACKNFSFRGVRIKRNFFMLFTYYFRDSENYFRDFLRCRLVSSGNCQLSTRTRAILLWAAPSRPSAYRASSDFNADLQRLHVHNCIQINVCTLSVTSRPCVQQFQTSLKAVEYWPFLCIAWKEVSYNWYYCVLLKFALFLYVLRLVAVLIVQHLMRIKLLHIYIHRHTCHNPALANLSVYC